ncbi:unnamed protein product [Rotaria sp. Silwood2]|nr:unnamed protein product [Rotaria sp. Silwood2]CAF4097778.1 unnamed protein product [Rotaria sp. Silwood2]CAF4195069.1 unnamed protein product [Rotaria sp. Silwood2]
MAEKTFRSKITAAKNDIVKLEQIEKECENDYNEVSKNLDNAQKTNPSQTDTINELKSVQVEKQINLLCAGLTAEKCADQRESVLAKQLLLGNKAGQIVILGLHNAGKSTLLRTLKDNPFDEYTSSLSSTHHHAQGGHLWKDYISSADSIVFLVDAADPIRFTKAKAELDVRSIKK